MKNVVLDIVYLRCLYNFDMEDSRIILFVFFFLLECGFCDCGRCNCIENWSGFFCSCSISLEGCIRDEVRLNLFFVDYFIILRSFGVCILSQLFFFYNVNLISSYIIVFELVLGIFV